MQTKRRIILKAGLVASALVACAAVVAMPWLAMHHIVRAPDGIVIVPKRYVSLAETRVDIRDWTWEEAQRQPALCAALEHAGYADLLPRPHGWSRLGRALQSTGSHCWQLAAARADRLAQQASDGVACLDRWFAEGAAPTARPR